MQCRPANLIHQQGENGRDMRVRTDLPAGIYGYAPTGRRLWMRFAGTYRLAGRDLRVRIAGPRAVDENCGCASPGCARRLGFAGMRCLARAWLLLLGLGRLRWRAPLEGVAWYYGYSSLR